MGVKGLGFRVKGLWSRVQDLRVEGIRFGVKGVELRVWGLGFWIIIFMV